MKVAFNLTQLLNSNSREVNKEEIKTLNFNIKNIDIDHIVPAKENFYSVDDIESIKQSIELLGIEQNLIVERIDRDNYKLVAGHRRYFASKALVEEGKEEFRILPCKIKSKSEDNTLLNKLTMIMTNSTTREITDWEKMQQSIEVEEIINQLKKENNIKGRTRDLLSEILNISSSQLGRYKAINNNLIDELQEEFKNNNINYSVAYKASQLTKEYQLKAFIKLQEEGSLIANDIDVLKAKEEYIRALEGQIAIDDSLHDEEVTIAIEDSEYSEEIDEEEDEHDEDVEEDERTEEEITEEVSSNIEEEEEKGEVQSEIHKNVEVQQLKSEQNDICTFCRENNNTTLNTEDEKILLYFDSSIRKIGVTNKETGEISFVKFNFCPACGRKIY
ncbi:ParB/RepB/Spo0J family partition protein [uncultured Clostridium sp.]|uniref:ParB/RepB/Spo0J family partition protein n=1 Tax=uncultured Clostridium sp. TaxID=59620 RepID=UPI00267288BD|nr:ParB/RepB/Spo0J family partition protein [uncultured Clostridium sp.]